MIAFSRRKRRGAARLLAMLVLLAVIGALLWRFRPSSQDRNAGLPSVKPPPSIIDLSQASAKDFLDLLHSKNHCLAAFIVRPNEIAEAPAFVKLPAHLRDAIEKQIARLWGAGVETKDVVEVTGFFGKDYAFLVVEFARPLEDSIRLAKWTQSETRFGIPIYKSREPNFAAAGFSFSPSPKLLVAATHVQVLEIAVLNAKDYAGKSLDGYFQTALLDVKLADFRRMRSPMGAAVGGAIGEGSGFLANVRLGEWGWIKDVAEGRFSLLGDENMTFRGEIRSDAPELAKKLAVRMDEMRLSVARRLAATPEGRSASAELRRILDGKWSSVDDRVPVSFSAAVVLPVFASISMPPEESAR